VFLKSFFLTEAQSLKRHRGYRATENKRFFSIFSVSLFPLCLCEKFPCFENMIHTKWAISPKNEEMPEEIINIRKKVFIIEQGTPEDLEFDGTDGDAAHLLIYENQTAVATGRIIFEEDGGCFLGRIAVIKEKRKEGYGDLVVRMLIRRAYMSGAEKQFVRAQVQAKGFYEKLGFKKISDKFIYDGILHIIMERTGDITGECKIKN